MKTLVVDAKPPGGNDAFAAFVRACAARGHEVVRLDIAGLDDGAVLGTRTPAIVIACAAGLARVRAAPGGRAPVVLAVADPSEVQALLDAGADDVIDPSADEAALATRLAVLERRVREEDRALTEPLRALPDLIVRFSGTGVILSIRTGPGYVPVLLHPSRVGQSVEQVFDAESAAVTRAAIEEVARERHPVLIDRAFSLPGVTRWFEHRFFPGTDDDVIALSRDITDRKEAEARLRESEMRAKDAERQLREMNERYEIVARATTDAVWDWDIATSVVVWNQTFHTIFGYTKAEVDAGLHWWSTKLHPDDRERVTNGLDAWVAGGDPTWAADYRFLTRDGRYAHISDRGYMIRDSAGRGTRAIGAMVDVTERTEMQRRLLLADRLASLGTLAAGVAHEINNPLTHVIGNVDVAVRSLGAEPGDVPRALEALADARLGADRVRSIVRDLRTFARVDEAKRDVVDVQVPLEWAARIAGHALQGRARLEIVATPVPPTLGDESRLGQVFVNLLVNAAQAIPEGDPNAHRVRVTTSHVGAFVVVAVEDDGVGIPADVRTRIFDPFFTTKDVGVGTGLGLSICHGIVTSLGGTIEVESEVGRGATFRVRLPVAAARTSVPAPTPAPASRGRRGHVLIVDDDALTRALLERTLGPEHDVTVLATAEQALALIQGGARFDVVFSDLMMPGMTGMDFHKALGRVAPDLAARVIFLTAGAMSAPAQRFLDGVSNAWIEKPFDLDALLEATRRRVG